MEVRIPSLNILTQSLNPLETIVFGIILNSIVDNENGCCAYSNKQMGGLFNVHGNSISRIINALIKKGYFQAGYDEDTNFREMILGHKTYKDIYGLDIPDFIEDENIYKTNTSNKRKISPSKRIKILERDSFTCQYCGAKAPEVKIEIDHIIPISKDGTNEIENLTTACFECNIGKSNKILKHG